MDISSVMDIREKKVPVQKFGFLSKINEAMVMTLNDTEKTAIITLRGGVEYLTRSMGRNSSGVETFLSGLTQWPGGLYALLQPKTGCSVEPTNISRNVVKVTPQHSNIE